jgi:hypothetical protein
MLILSKRYGRLCNRLFNATHILALAIEYNHTFVNLAFYEYAEHFESTQNDIFCRYPSRTSGIKNRKSTAVALYYLAYAFSASLYFLSKLGLGTNWLKIRTVRPVRDKITRQVPDLDLPSLPIDYSDTEQVIFFQGWNLRSLGLINKHRDKIREYFQPAAVFRNEVASFVRAQREGYDQLIGIVIRHGDYSRYLGGKYYYSVDKYVRWMLQLKALQSGKRVKFLIFSDEEQDTDLFTSAGLDFYFRSGHMMENLYSLAECDCLVTPPSTYGMWASFYGQTPLCIVDDPEHILSLPGSFAICGASPEPADAEED